ncbi:hypothetical protein AB4455_09040 [Vibrio sp. 10N.261.46.E12]|uniref:hypothetical protein n=1 Tax=unclassified Vibrio TaxID=2614977 RepID=UPI0012FFF880|nr:MULTISPECIES: hypothetical protein [unclassified Vibrio]
MKMTSQRNKVINIAAAISIVLFSAIPTYANNDEAYFTAPDQYECCFDDKSDELHI